MNFLNQVIKQKQKEIKVLEGQYANNAFFKLFQQKRKGTVLIAEIKPKSPSGGVLYGGNLLELAKTYQSAGANAISVLTDKKFFGGSPELLQEIKKIIKVPILRKEFIISQVQLVESLLLGADAVLLIARILKFSQLKKLIDFSLVLGLAPVVEVFSEKDLRVALGAGAQIIGINSRDIQTLKINEDQALRVLKKIPNNVISLFFSGIKTQQDVQRATNAGAKGVLVGTALLQAKDPAEKIKDLKRKL